MKPYTTDDGHAIDVDDLPTGRTHAQGSEDDEQAAWLAGEFEGTVRYDHTLRRWHEWNGFRWAPDQVRSVPRRVKELTHRRLKAIPFFGASDEKKKALTKVYRRLLDVGRTDSALVALAEHEEYKTDGRDWDKEEHLLGCDNGIVNLTSGKLVRKPSSDLRVTRTTGIVFSEHADFNLDEECRVFLGFLRAITADRDGRPQEDLAEYLVYVFAAALFGHVKPQQFWVFVGPGGAGKGTLCKVMAHVFGVGQYASFPERTLYTKSRFGDPGSDRARSDLLGLQGSRLAIISEPPGPFNDELLKNHSGDDPITARALYSGNLVTWRPSHTIVFSSNNPPRVEDVGESMRRRLRAVPFVRMFGDHPDVTLEDRMKEEAPAILRLLVDYASRYAADPGVLDLARAPVAVQEASAAYIEDSDPLAAFLRDCCVLDRRAKMDAGALYDAYTDWHASSDQDGDPMTRTGFGLALAAKHIEKQRSNSRTWYVGIGLRDGDQEG